MAPTVRNIPGPVAPSADTPAPPMVDQPVLLSVRGVTMTRDRKTKRAFEIDDRLRSGDFFAYHVRVDRDAYIYVVQFFADGVVKVLFPAAGSERVIAGVEMRIPGDPGGWFRLDDSVGTEHMYLIASVSPLEAADPPLAELVGDVRSSPKTGEGSHGAAPDAGSPAGPPKPAASTTPTTSARPSAGVAPLRLRYPRSRQREVTLVRVQEDGVVTYQGRTGQDGVGIAHFPFRHER